MTQNQLPTLKRFCLDGGQVHCFLDQDDEPRFNFYPPKQLQFSDQEKVTLCQEFKSLFSTAAFMPRDPDAYVKYVCTKCDCCDDILLMKEETLTIA